MMQDDITKTVQSAVTFQSVELPVASFVLSSGLTRTGLVFLFQYLVLIKVLMTLLLVCSGAVLCVAMSSSGEQCFSGGVDGTVQSWNTPGPNVDPYDSYGTFRPRSHDGRCRKCSDRSSLFLLWRQSRLSCGGRCAVTPTQSGAWSTARPTIASSPARLTERSGCGTPQTRRRRSPFSTREEVSRILD